jgi:hypothetical protein
MYTGRQPKT